MRNIALLSVLLIFVLGFSSCKKDKDTEPDYSALIVSKNWRLTALTYNNQDAYNILLDDCSQDDITMFTSDGRYKIVEGATRCDPTDPETIEEGTWSITGQKIMINGTDSYEANIDQLDNSTLKISTIDPFFGTGQMAVFTYTAQ